MEFRQLEAFIKVVELGSFSKAAKELHVSQPSVSTYISSLERELGTALLNRSTKVVSPTLAGTRFFDRAKELIALRNESIEAVKDLSEDHSGEIRIIASSVPASAILPKILSEFTALYPKVSFVVEQADTAAAVDAVAKNRADIGFAGSIVKNDVCSFQEFIDEELVFIGPPKLSSQAASKVHTLEELLYQNRFISREQGSGTRIQYEKFFTDKGIDLKKINSCATMGDTQSIINSVASGLGISIVSELVALSAIDQKLISVLRSEEKVPHRKIYTVLRAKVKHPRLVKLFLEHLEQPEVSNETTL